MGLSRRAILTLMGIESLFLATGCSRRATTPASHSSLPPHKNIDRSQYTLQQLVQETDDPVTGYKSFSTLLHEAGFQITPIINKHSDQQVLIFAEDHTEETAGKITSLTDILISTYGFDSIGLEMVYGSPSPTMLAEVQANLNSVLGDTYHRDRVGAVTIETDLLTTNFSPHYEKYLHQKSVPTYGLEDEGILIEITVIEAYKHSLRTVQTIARKMMKSSTGNTSAALPQGLLIKINSLLERLRMRYTDLQLPPVCLYDLILPPVALSVEQYNGVHQQFHQQLGYGCNIIPSAFSTSTELQNHQKKLQAELQYFIDATERSYKFDFRNQAMVGNIHREMGQLNSKKGIIIVGEAHVFGRLRGPIDTVNTIPHLIPYSSVAINATRYPVPM